MSSSEQLSKQERVQCHCISQFIAFDASTPHCHFSAEVTDDQTSSNIGPDHMKNIILDLFFAGSDTTATTLNWFLLYMIRFPDVQQRCREEIDEVLGPEGLLTKSALGKDFPFTTASMMECQRLSPIFGASLPHVVKDDATVGGCPIKKGDALQASIRFLHLDERYWSDPLSFKPERWLDSSDSNKLVHHTHFLPFSIGKRRCMVEHLAKAEYAIFAISLLRNFIFRMEDPSNPPSLDGVGMLYSPKPYKMIIQNRTLVET